MVVGAQVGDCPHVGVLVLWLGLVVLFGHVVDAVVVIGLALGIHHWSVVSFAGVALLLNVPLFLTVAAQDVGVPGSIGAALVSWPREISPGLKPVISSPNCSHLFDLLFSKTSPSNGISFLRLELGLYCCNLLGTSMIKLDGFKFSSKLQGLSKSVFLGLLDLVAEVVTEAGEE